MTPRPVLAVVGPGRVGWALARAARAVGYEVASVAGGAEAARARLAESVGARPAAAPADVAGNIVLLALPDAALAPTAAAVRTRSDAWLVHTAGALPAAALGVPRVGTFHPLRSFVGEPRDVDLAGYGVALEADDVRLESHLRQLAEDLAMVPLSIAPADRVHYHAAAVLAGNAPVALLHLAQRHLSDVQVPRELAEAVLIRLFASVAENATGHGISGALSGPVRRGDVETVRRHLHVLRAADAATADLYAALALASLEVVRELPDGPDETAVDALRALLKRGGAG